jgi:hypothetical protein
MRVKQRSAKTSPEASAREASKPSLAESTPIAREAKTTLAKTNSTRKTRAKNAHVRNPAVSSVAFSALHIKDEPAFRGLPVYHDLKAILLRAQYPFRVARSMQDARFLNLTFWDGAGDVLDAPVIFADVVTHVGWHYLAARAMPTRSAHALFLGESIASAFDLYLIGALLQQGKQSSFLATQVEAMSEAALAAGVSAKQFRSWLAAVATLPGRSFAELQQLLFEATKALFHADNLEAAAEVLASFAGRTHGFLLHHYALSNWVLYARAHATKANDAKTENVARSLAQAADPLIWLVQRWVVPALR